MNILKTISSLLEDKPALPDSVVTETPPAPKELSPKEKVFQEAEMLAQKWRDAGVAVQLRDHKGQKGGQEFKILSVELEESKGHQRHWIVMRLEWEHGIVLLGFCENSLGCLRSSDESGWELQIYEDANHHLVTLEDSKIPANQKEIEAWKNPNLQFKIRQKEGKPCYTIWFSHNGYTKGVFQPVRPAGTQPYYPEDHMRLNNGSKLLELDSLEAAREVVEILKTRENVTEIAYFQRQFADVEGEFYTVETIKH